MQRLGWPLTNTQKSVSKQLINNGFKDNDKTLIYTFDGINILIEKERLKKRPYITVQMEVTADFLDFKIIYDKWTTTEILDDLDEIKKSIKSDLNKLKK